MILLRTEVGLGQHHRLLDGDPAPSLRKGHSSPPLLFGPCLLWPNGWMDQDVTNSYGGRPGLPGHIALDGDPGATLETDPDEI